MVISDAREPNVAEIAARNLEVIFNLLGGLFQPHVESQPEPYKIVAFLFATRSSFDAFKARVEAYEWSAPTPRPASATTRSNAGSGPARASRSLS